MFFTALKINTVPALTATAQLFCRPVVFTFVLHNKSLKKNIDRI